MTSLAELSMNDLPPRTWRIWWGERPKWLRIALWAFVAAMVVNLLVTIRIGIGLIESEDIAAFRRTGGHVYYFDTLGNRSEWFPGQRAMIEGLWGRSGTNVRAVIKDGADDGDLKFIAAHFPRVQFLELWHADVTADGFAALQACSELRHIETQATDIDDESAKEILRFPRLNSLQLYMGIVSRELEPLVVSLNDANPELSQWSDFGAKDHSLPAGPAGYPLELIIRWADGQRSANVKLPFQLVIETPAKTSEQRIVPYDAGQRLEAFAIYPKHHLTKYGDGVFRFHLRLGGYHLDPMEVSIVEGVAAAERLEFQMPVTKAEAFR